MRLGAWALRLADRLVLQAYVPLSIVGIYSLGYTLGSTVFDLIASSVNSAILPFFYRTATETSEQASKRTFARIAAWDAALLAFLGLGTVLFAREFILIVATERYAAAEPVVPLVVWASIFQSLAHVPTRAIYLVKKTGYLPLVSIVPAVLNVALNFVLIPRYGMMGAAVSTLAAYPVLFFLTLAMAQHLYRIPYDYVRMAKPLVILLVLSLVARAVPSDSLMAAVAIKTLLLATFPVALLGSGFLTGDERRALSHVVRQLAHLAPAAREGRQLP